MKSSPPETWIAIVGCGFVADYYMATLAHYPWLRVAGVFDLDAGRLQKFCSHYQLTAYADFDALLSDARTSIVVNLTNPRAHFEISRRCLEAGKHVYSEKPLAMEYAQAESLVRLAEIMGLQISSAPCSLLANAAQTLWRAVRERVVGDIRLVYAELDDGMVHKMPYQKWVSASGAPWPYKDEFEVGCTLEHAGYYLGWLIAMFGPVERVTSSAECLLPDKLAATPLQPGTTPDFSVGILKFESGVVTRLTSSIVAPHNHTLQVIGESGVLEVKDCWFNDAKVRVRKLVTLRRRTFLSPLALRYKAAGAPRASAVNTGGARMDFAAGPAELALSLVEQRPSVLSPRFSLHVNEVALALQNVRGEYLTRSRFDPVAPAAWTLAGNTQ
jgi:predicted dehydrogenase